MEKKCLFCKSKPFIIIGVAISMSGWDYGICKRHLKKTIKDLIEIIEERNYENL